MKSVTAAAGVLALCASAALVGSARADSFDHRPKIMLHALSTTSKNQCGFGSLSDCTTATVTKDLSTPQTGPFYYVYVLCAEGPAQGGFLSNGGVSGIEWGINYQNGAANAAGDGIGVDIFGWTKCAALEFITPTPVWPNPGGGSLITWLCTSYMETSVAGYFYTAAYSADKFSIIPRPISGFMKVADCPNGAELLLNASDGGFISFSSGASVAGCNPCNQLCGEVPVEATTWGKLKSLFSR